MTAPTESSDQKPEGPTIHLMCGLVASGKTTLATELAAALPAVRLSRDEWMIRLYGLEHDEPDYVERLGPCTELLWDVAVEILNVGRSVVLDWNFGSRQRRSDARERADRAGYPIRLDWLDVPLEVAVDRATGRIAAQPSLAHRIDADAVRHFASIFEPPADDEELAVQRHRIPPTADRA